MRNVLLLSFVLALGQASAQTPASPRPVSTPQTKPAAPQTQPPPAQPQPAQPAPRPAAPPANPANPTAPAPRRAPAPTSRGGIAVTTTSPQGATLTGVRVSLSGPTERTDETNASGQVTMPSLLTGTYRIRFEGEKVATFEKEITVTAGKVTQVDVMLNPAPEPKVVAAPPPPAPAPPATGVGPKGQPLTLGVVDVLEKDFVGRQPRRESLLSCTGNLRTSMIQLNEPMPPRSYDTAEAMYYVLGGEGTISMDGRETRLATNGFASVPRGVAHSFTRRGNRALVLLAVLSGEPCEQAR